MLVKAKCVDDILRNTYAKILKSGQPVSPTKGANLELFPAQITLTNPLARLSHSESRQKIVSCIGELSWYLSKSDRLADIECYIPDYWNYSDDGLTIYGAYGPRLFYKFGFDQLEYIVKKLTKNSASRKAIVHLSQPADFIDPHKDVPCTCTIQFLIRKDRLHCIVHMRSNDAYKGLPHDIFCFTIIQELIAKRLNKRLGHYHHLVGSLHLYDVDKAKAESYISEGWQSSMPMPQMAPGPQEKYIEHFCRTMNDIRIGAVTDVNERILSPYWADFARIMQIHKLIKDGDRSSSNLKRIAEIRRNLSNEYFNQYVARKARRLKRSIRTETTGDLKFD